MSTLGPADITALKARGQRIAVVTAYDAPSARLADAAGVDIVLVGDSAAMTVFGYDSTTPITVDDMLCCPGPCGAEQPARLSWPTCRLAPSRCRTRRRWRTRSAS